MPTTGDTLLADAGMLAYNGVIFSVLFKTEINGEYVLSNDGKTIFKTRYTLTAEGIVSPDGHFQSLDQNFGSLLLLLSQAGGQLTYQGRGFANLLVNPPGRRGNRDVEWGPTPKVLFFQPLGNGLSARVRWQCSFTIFEGPQGDQGQVLQFSYGATVSFDEKYYSTIAIRGVLEVAMTRTRVNTHTIPAGIVDSFRRQWENIGFDMTKFRVVRRSFDDAPDMRICKFEYAVEELPPMDLPPGCPHADGSFDVQTIQRGNSKLAFGLQWSCTLRADYTVRKDWPRRTAANEFYLLLLERMDSSSRGIWPDGIGRAQQQPGTGTAIQGGVERVLRSAADILVAAAGGNPRPVQAGPRPAQAMLSSFSFRERLYLGSPIMSFEASWILFTTFRTLLDASGVWSWPKDGGAFYPGRMTWRGSLRAISGYRSWLDNQLDPGSQVIVDMSGGTPPQQFFSAAEPDSGIPPQNAQYPMQ